MDVLFEFESGTIIQFGIHEASSGGGIRGGEIELNGTKADLIADQDGYTITPARPGQFQLWESLTEQEEYSVESDETYGDLGISEPSTGKLIRNFLDCVKSGDTPWCPLEEGHRSTSFAHLANISLATGMRIEWDPGAERITNSEKANELLHYEYRKPWPL